MNGLWDVIRAQQVDEKGLGPLGVAVFLEEDVQHVSTFIDHPTQPVPCPTDLDAALR